MTLFSTIYWIYALIGVLFGGLLIKEGREIAAESSKVFDDADDSRKNFIRKSVNSFWGQVVICLSSLLLWFPVLVFIIIAEIRNKRAK